MNWEQAVHWEAGTDVGLRRKNNEDSYAVHLCKTEAEWNRGGHLLIVADGMGGHAVGEIASQLAVETIANYFETNSSEDPRELLEDAITAANQLINTKGNENPEYRNMGTTCSVLALTRHGAIIGHVGDSRVYRVRRDRVDQLTFDHSLQWELERQHGSSLEGIIDFNQHKNIITRSLGPEKHVEVDIEGPLLVFPGDLYLLCSDGLSNQVSDPEIGAALRELPPSQAAKFLIDLSNLRGGPDNITAVVVRVGELAANLSVTSQDAMIIRKTKNQDLAKAGGFWASAVCVACGFALFLFRQESIGLTMLLVGFVLMASIFIYSVMQKKLRRQQAVVDESQTVHSRPYRTAVGLNSKDFAELLRSILGELSETARSSGWGVNWSEYDALIESSKKLDEENRFSRSGRGYAKAIRMLMSKLPRQTSPV